LNLPHKTRPVRFVQELVEHTIRHEYPHDSKTVPGAVIASNGALAVYTGERTGRSANDRYIVTQQYRDEIDWGPINIAYEPDRFSALWDEAVRHADSLEDPLWEQHLRVGADPHHAVGLRVFTKYAWHGLFANTMFIRQPPTPEMEEWTILNLPSFHTDVRKHGTNSDCSGFIDLDHKRILLCGLHYGGEMKKAVFTVMNFILPRKGVLPMHCSANVGEHGDVAVFLGLSGTGKTTLGSDPNRRIIGDDEHGWSEHGLFNFEGGCYAKGIKLTREREPVIYDAIREGAIIENVVLDELRRPLYDCEDITENIRVAYPLSHIENRDFQNRGWHPQSQVLLSYDAYGVLPPVAGLTVEQAVYYYLSGYTAKVGSTEVGSTAQIEASFSSMFGAPFFPCKPKLYADLYERKLREHSTRVYNVSTGYTGGPFGSKEGRRFEIGTSRAVVNSAISGALDSMPQWHMEEMNLQVPEHVPGVLDKHLHPLSMWTNPRKYKDAMRELVDSFHKNWDKKFGGVSTAIRDAGPRRY